MLRSVGVKIFLLQLTDHFRDYPLRQHRTLGLIDFLNDPKPWDFNCLRHDLYLWNLHDQHNRDIDHTVSVLLLDVLYGLLNPSVHADLLLRHDKNANHFVDELQQ